MRTLYPSIRHFSSEPMVRTLVPTPGKLHKLRNRHD